MFTGIVANRGTIRRARPRRGGLELEIETTLARHLGRGDSAAVNGVCLTATGASRRRFSTAAMPETLHRTTLGDLHRGDPVNLELPLRASDRLGGHLVQGHVDGVATVVRMEATAAATRVWMTAGDEILRYLAPKGSVALDGVSLTVVEAGPTGFQVALIPHTLEATTLGALEDGRRVNVEVDVLAKYVVDLVGGRSSLDSSPGGRDAAR